LHLVCQGVARPLASYATAGDSFNLRWKVGERFPRFKGPTLQSFKVFRRARNNYSICNAPSQVLTPLYSQVILRIYAASATNGLGGGAQIDYVPGHGKP